MRVATVVGTRPEIIRLSRVIAALDASVGIQHTLIHTEQNYDHELNEIFFEEMGIRKPDVRTFSSSTDYPASAIDILSNMMRDLESEFLKHKPEAVLILGDTNSCLAAAYVAKRMKIPLFHMEAGNRSYDERVPEEVNRKMIDHIADINLPYSTIAREALIREGVPADRVIKTGSPLREVLDHYTNQIHLSPILDKLLLMDTSYFVVSVHREENVDTPEKFKQLCDLLNKLADTYHSRIIVSAHPRVRAKLESFGGDFRNEIEIHKPFGFFDYVKLQKNATCVLSDSGTITEEASILQFAALNLREAHERPEGMEEAAVMMTGFNPDRVMDALPLAQDQTHVPKDYQDDDVAAKVVRIILSYVDYVNRVVWRKK